MIETLVSKPLQNTRIRSFGSFVDSLCKTALYSKLSKLEWGELSIRDGDDCRTFGKNNTGDLKASITVMRSNFYTRATLGGSIGVAESYTEGDWMCDDLASLVRIFVANREILNSLDGGLGSLLQPLERLLHKARRNTVDKAKDNIHAHYDLGNDFFALFLDETMMYSCGIFPSTESTLAEASTEKNDRICRKLNLTPNDRVIEIGTGWGGFAIHAAKNYGCHVTTTTISKAQFEMAQQRIKKEGLESRITLLFEDYRNLKGTYDKLVSIEMVEAVGLDHLGTYFKACGNLLSPSGSMLIQAITIQDRFYEQARKSVDFIQKHIFPGSGIPSISSLVKASSMHTDMRLFHQEDITANYPLTLRAWSRNLKENKEKFLELGYSEQLYRLWEFYFGYCEGGFMERSIGVAQMLFTKPKNKMEPLLGIL
jgi:cyclopropane-fatty-acyl-phospholipid synthase